jgi:branched-subunit amino acid aminotransferase/4-amino-4-deoxychorismate lyase
MLEQTLMPEDLYAADEVFITSTNRSLLEVSEIAGHTYAAAPGPVAQKLERAFSAAMREYVAQRTASVRT